MAEAEVLREINHATAPMNGDLRDLLQRFACGKTFPGKIGVTAQNEEEEEEDEMELSLGLSLNGQFGVDPNMGKKPTRSSSISDFKAPLVAPPTAYAPLMRTCSLPAETEEGWRKRKELQSFRRMEAKKKRLQKIKDVKAVRDQANLEANSQAESGINRMRGDVSAQGSESNGVESGTQELPPQTQPSSQGSIGSLGTCSSGISESESQPTQGANKCTGDRSPAGVRSLLGPASVRSLPKQNENKLVVTPGTATEKSAKLVGAATFNTSDAMEIMRNMMVDMPCVSTRGVGPNGKTVEGFLYRYRKGEEVRIVCVCHGSFLSPAEFVKHAGGGDVAHPLKHIVVNPSPLS